MVPRFKPLWYQLCMLINSLCCCLRVYDALTKNDHVNHDLGKITLSGPPGADSRIYSITFRSSLSSCLCVSVVMLLLSSENKIKAFSHSEGIFMTKSLPWPMAFMNYKITDPTKPDKWHIAEAFSGRKSN